MTSNENIDIPQNSTSLLKVVVDDISNYFISYWNLSLKKLLTDYFCSFNSNIFGSVKLPLNSLNIKLVNINTTLDNIFEDKLFTIKVFFLNSEKDLDKEYYNTLKNSYELKNLNLILISVNEIKKEENILKDCNKIMNKIKSKTGLNDLCFLPHSIFNFNKLEKYFNEFLDAFAKKFSKEFFAKVGDLSRKLKNIEKSNEYEYGYIQDIIYYLELLTQMKNWNIILDFTEKKIFTRFKFLEENKYQKINPMVFFYYDVNDLKMSYINHKLSNTEFNEYILYNYIVSSHFMGKYENISKLIKLVYNNIDSYFTDFKTEFHYFFWIINYLYIFKNYFEKIKSEKYNISQNIILISSLCIKYFKKFISKSKQGFILDKNILNKLINNIKNNKCDKIKEEMENLINNKNNENKIENKDYNLFINDFQDIKDNDKIFLILNDNKKLLNEILSLYKSINSNFKNIQNFKISIQCILEEVYLLISFCQFDEVKNILSSFIKHKFFMKKKFKFIYEYICFILLLVLNYIEKNNENLNLIFKLLNVEYSSKNKIFKLINCEDNNIIYEIISKYIESYNPGNEEKKKEINFELNNILSIKLFNGSDKTIFVNKSKDDIIKIEFEIANKLGLELKINKIIIIFNELDINNNHNENKIIYEINEEKNLFKKLTPYMSQKNEFFEIETKNKFKPNYIYQPTELRYVLNNSIVAIYHLKEKIEIFFSDININIKSELDSSFYYNILSTIKINILNIKDISELNDNNFIIYLNDGDKNNSNYFLQIHTEIMKQKYKDIFKEIIIDNNFIEFPAGSIKNIFDINNLEIPFFIENIDYYTNNDTKINLKICLKASDGNIIFSYSKIYSHKFSHLFTIGKRFKLLKSNSYLMQTFLSLNIDKAKIKIYNSDSFIIIDSKQAYNMILILGEKLNDIINKLRTNFIKFSLNDNDNIIYQFCYPEKNILDEIKEIKEIPYHISINLDEDKGDKNEKYEIYKEINANINIKKYKKSKVKFMINILENNNWSIIGRNKIIEELDEEKCEKNIKIILLPLVDGFVPLPELEFNECIMDSKYEEYQVEKFEPIEFGTIIDGEKNVLKIEPLKEYNLKIDLT